MVKRLKRRKIRQRIFLGMIPFSIMVMKIKNRFGRISAGW